MSCLIVHICLVYSGLQRRQIILVPFLPLSEHFMFKSCIANSGKNPPQGDSLGQAIMDIGTIKDSVAEAVITDMLINVHWSRGIAVKEITWPGFEPRTSMSSFGRTGPCNQCTLMG